MADIIRDVHSLYDHYGFTSKEMSYDRLLFRYSLLFEEMSELQQAIEATDSDETVDALIDIVVIALGTLQLCDVDIDKAWTEVQNANMRKCRGAKAGRSTDSFDLMKPDGWKAPDHSDNTGILSNLLRKNNEQRGK